MIKKTPADEAEQIQQAILMREVEEEIQKERLLNFWKKYKFFLIGAVVGVIAATSGNEIYHSWYEKTRLAESDQFEQAAVLNYTGNSADAATIYLHLAQSAKTGYAELSLMRLAEIAFENGDLDGGLKYLRQLIDDSSASTQLRNVARLTYVGYQSETADSQKLIQELKPILSDSKSALYPTAVELKAAILYHAGQKEDAKKTITDTIKGVDLSDEATERLQALLSVID